LVLNTKARGVGRWNRRSRLRFESAKAHVPVREFWSFTVCGLETSGFLLDSTRLTLSSLDNELRKNADGSTDIYIGPKPPSGQESNWLYTPAGQKWFSWFRVYGPEKTIFDKSWKLADMRR
jgi:hypothetical protein